MFWNCFAKKDFRIDSPPGAVNWAIGCRGSEKNGDAYWASWGIPVLPRSMFVDQLKNRLGPLALDAILISEQMNNKDIWGLLQNWAGNGNPLVGL